MQTPLACFIYIIVPVMHDLCNLSVVRFASHVWENEDVLESEGCVSQVRSPEHRFVFLYLRHSQ